jgi:branched-chain amino acid transport system substrate-binding protein
MPLLSRRSTVALGASFAAATALRVARADDKTFRIALNLPFTGGEAEGAIEIRNGVMLAVDEINAKGGVAGYKLAIVLMDDGTSTAGGYDPGQAATNARKMATDPTILAALGPYNSGSGKAMSPILSAANLRSSRRARRTQTSPTPSSHRSTGRRAPRPTSALSRPMRSRGRTWRTTTPRS